MARRSKKRTGGTDDVPGISSNPSTNLMMADIAMRSGTTLMRHLLESKMLKGRYGKESAQAIVKSRSMTRTLASVLVAKVATRSVPGAIVIGGGALVKTLFDRSQKRRKARRTGDETLLSQAKDS